MDPLRPNLTEGQWNEYTLLTMGDEHWSRFNTLLLEEQMKAVGDGVVLTGDPVADDFERQIQDENAARRAAKGASGGE